MKTKGATTPKIHALSLAIAASLATPYAIAAEADAPAKSELETIVVTSQKRQQTLKEVPLSVSAVNGSKLEQSGITQLSELSTYIPNFAIQKGSLGDTINIRGMQSGNQAGFEQSVGTFVNGIYRGRGPQSRFSFMDVERVEVLRGPQSILFGKNTVAGALNITTAEADSEFNGKVSASYNLDHEATEYSAMITGALTDDLNGRMFIVKRDMDKGWVHNNYYDQGSPQNDELMGRATLDWQMTSDSRVKFVYEASDFDAAVAHSMKVAGPLAAFGAKDDSWDESNIGNEGPIFDIGSEQSMTGKHNEFSLTSETQFENGLLTAIFGQSNYDYSRFTDADYSALNALRYDDSEEFEQTSFELRYNSQLGDNFEYTAGLYWQTQKLTTDSLSYFNLPTLQNVMYAGCGQALTMLGGDINQVFVPGDAVQTAAGVVLGVPGAPASIVNGCGLSAAFVGAPAIGRYAQLQQDTDTLGVFAQGTWHFSDDLRTTFGLRYTNEEKSANQNVHTSNLTSAGDKQESMIPPLIALGETVGEFKTHHFTDQDPGMSRDENSPTWLLNLQYDLSDATTTYATTSTGYKSGGFNSFYMASIDTQGNRYADSNDVSFDEEQATTYELGLKTTLFDNRADLNIALFRTSFEDLQVSIFSGNTTFEVRNAAEATTQGLEVDGRWLITDDLTMYGSLGLLDFGYDDFKNQACTSDQFIQRRQAIYTQMLSSGNVPGAIGTALGYSNANCAREEINDLTNRTSEHSPQVKASLAFEHYLELGNYQLQTNVDMNYLSETYRVADLDPVGLESAKTFFNASMSLSPTEGDWKISLIGKNLSDERHMSFINDIPMFAGAHGFVPQPGRSFTVKFDYYFGDY
ncbi:TonB-dependent receptor [Thalassotalea litorea]|uniref:TonB-dependent receptor n=1 Tax=Thalassotalea litorea TaxID=2020715 RepID=UPI0037354555